jgi:hypothetical protein
MKRGASLEEGDPFGQGSTTVMNVRRNMCGRAQKEQVPQRSLEAS